MTQKVHLLIAISTTIFLITALNSLDSITPNMIASMALLRSLVLLSSWAAAAVGAGVPVDPNLKPCGDAWYLSSMYTCYDGNTLCPVSNGVPTLRCGPDCYLPSMYR
jgi:hypothetical protein